MSCLDRKSLEVAPNINILWFFWPFSHNLNKRLPLKAWATGLFAAGCWSPQRPLGGTSSPKWVWILLRSKEHQRGIYLVNTGRLESCLLHGDKNPFWGSKAILNLRNMHKLNTSPFLFRACCLLVHINNISGFSPLPIVICPEKLLNCSEGPGRKIQRLLSEFLGQENSMRKITCKAPFLLL